MTDQPPASGTTPGDGDEDAEAGGAIGTEPEPAPEPEPEPQVGDEPEGAPEPAPAVDTPPEAPVDPVPVAAATEAADGDEEPASRSLPWKPFAAILVVFIILGVGLFFLLKKDGESDMVKVEDEVAGFTIEYPKEWITLREPIGDERLLVSPGGQNYLFIRVLPIDPEEDARTTIEEGLATADPPVKVERSQEISINGTDGFFYLYTFTDSSTGVLAVHSHYFLVRGPKMYVLVFQALPTSEFQRLADTYAKVAESFKSTSDKPLPSTTSTTAADTTPTTAPATTPTS